MPNELVTPPAEPVAPAAPQDEGPSREEILGALRQEQAAREALQMENMRLRQPPPGPPPPDSLDRYTKEGLALPAAEQRELLDDAIARRAEAVSARHAAELDRRNAIRMQQQANENALQAVVMQHPDLADPKNHPKFAAAMFEVEMEARQKGVTLTPHQLAQQAAQKYRATVQPGAPAPPFVEGGGNPSIPRAGGAPPEPELNSLEEVYGLPAGTIKPLINPEKQLQEETERFIRDGNAEMFKRGVRSNMRGISQTLVAKTR